MADEHESLVLASASPRRRQLLAEAGYKFTVCPAEVEECGFPEEGVSPGEHAEGLALAKARDIAAKFPDRLVIGADTVVDSGGETIGKAADAEEAERITRKLFGAPHKVITAVAVVRLGDGVEIVESDTTTVYPRRMSDEQITEHIRSGSWRDKAGAYAIQEGGDEFIERIEGSLTNVMGLPMVGIVLITDSGGGKRHMLLTFPV
jgi:septum formation protein